jgi:hypothetical protein
MTSRTILTTAILALCTLLTACQSDGSGGGGNTQASVGTTPTPAPPQNTSKVKDGRPPLQYNFAAGGNVRVIDATTGKEIVRTRVAPNTVLHVNTDGVFANDQRLNRTEWPLAADHQYEIWLDR